MSTPATPAHLDPTVEPAEPAAVSADTGEWRAINGMTRDEVLAYLTSDEAMANEEAQRLKESAATFVLPVDGDTAFEFEDLAGDPGCADCGTSHGLSPRARHGATLCGGCTAIRDDQSGVDGTDEPSETYGDVFDTYGDGYGALDDH